jgi:predicted metal-dependent phosphoesterase TrpH
MMRKNELFDGEGNVIESVDVPFTLDEKTAHLSALRDAHLYGGITVAGITIGTDDQTIDRLHKAYDALKEWNPDGVKKWKAKGGFVELNMTQIGALLQAIDAHVQKCFDAESAILPEITNFSSSEELEAAFHAALSK